MNSTAYLVEWCGSVNGSSRAIALVKGTGRASIARLYDMLDDIGDVSAVRFQIVGTDSYVELHDRAFTRVGALENNWKKFKGWDSQCPAP
tara:strand:+ start:63 stop:332 length:270 start_codon:yes stop_codon:yes gene_type:complete